MKRWRVAVALVCLLVVVALGVERTAPFGARVDGLREERIASSALFEEGKAQNLIPTSLSLNRHYLGAWGRYRDNIQEPQIELPVLTPSFSGGPATELTVTWLGHSSILVELDGVRILTDPMLSDRASPFSFMGPMRFHPAPMTAAELPPIDAVVISHDHYDHLDMQTVEALADREVPFLVPLGVGAHLEAWGLPAERIVELEWWQEFSVKGLRVVCTPARHFSGRGITDRNQTLWASWAFVGGSQRAWFSGDTGPFPQAAQIGQRLGPFDLTMLEVGAYDRAWSSVHLGPDAALTMHQQLRGRVLLPIHWGTFNLALHSWDQPMVRLMQGAQAAGISLLGPVAGQTLRPAEPQVHSFWKQRADVWRSEQRPTD